MKLARLRIAAIWITAFGGLSLIGGLLLFTRFMVYDDEGYVLWSVHDYCAGNSLYEEVYTQYGPLFFVGYRALCAATGLVLDSDTARLITLAYWLAASGMAAACARLLTGSRVVALSTCGLVFLVLVSNSNEPFHPGSLLALLAAIFAWLGVRALTRDQENRFVWGAALVAACATLIKINVGGLLFIALGSWMAVNGSGRIRPSRSVALALLGALALLPGLLMARHLALEGYLRFAIVIGGMLLGISPFLWRDRREVFPPKAWLPLAAIPSVVGLGVMALLLVQGSSPAAILDGILLGPLRHPGIYVSAPRFPAAAVLLAGLALLFVHTLHPRLRRGEDILAALQILGALWFIGTCLNPLTGRPPDRFTLYFGPALALLFVLPRHDHPRDPRDRAALWLGWVYLWQTLQAYPVAGSQVAWGSFLWVPLALHGLHRGLGRFRARLKSAHRAPELLIGGTVAVGVLHLGLLGADWWKDSAPLGFPGARWIQPQTQQAEDIRAVRRNLLVHADTVVTLPGMFSFNLWTHLPPPTHANVTHWFNLLDEGKQREAIAALKNARRPALVVMPGHLEFLAEQKIRVGGPLFDYLQTEFRPAIHAGTYEIWLPRGRAAPGVDSFVILRDGLEACTEALSAPVFAAILRESQAVGSTWVELRPSPALPWESGPLAEHPGLLRHRLRIPPLTGRHDPDDLRLELVDRAGRVLAACRFDQTRQALIDGAPPTAN